MGPEIKFIPKIPNFSQTNAIIFQQFNFIPCFYGKMDFHCFLIIKRSHFTKEIELIIQSGFNQRETRIVK